jgi:putative glutathione S-transferase
VSYSPKHLSFRTFAMTSTRDTSLQADIGKMKLEADGSFNRAASSFRNCIQEGGQFTPERDRYHLYVSYSCPWATRTLITRKLKGLEDIVRACIAFA